MPSRASVTRTGDLHRRGGEVFTSGVHSTAQVDRAEQTSKTVHEDGEGGRHEPSALFSLGEPTQTELVTTDARRTRCPTCGALLGPGLIADCWADARPSRLPLALRGRFDDSL